MTDHNIATCTNVYVHVHTYVLVSIHCTFLMYYCAVIGTQGVTDWYSSSEQC